jgi:enamine deaminase RidA (YjgF/YER057c/UK114 family)
MTRLNVPAATPWASTIAYSRAVRIGPFVAVSQTSAVDADGRIAGGDDPYEQAVRALANLEAGLSAAGARLDDVIRTRVYLARFDDLDAVLRAHAEVFGTIRPAITILTATMVDPAILVEFDADAVIADDGEATDGR